MSQTYFQFIRYTRFSNVKLRRGAMVDAFAQQYQGKTLSQLGSKSQYPGFGLGCAVLYMYIIVPL